MSTTKIKLLFVVILYGNCRGFAQGSGEIEMCQLCCWILQFTLKIVKNTESSLLLWTPAGQSEEERKTVLIGDFFFSLTFFHVL